MGRLEAIDTEDFFACSGELIQCGAAVGAEAEDDDIESEGHYLQIVLDKIVFIFM